MHTHFSKRQIDGLVQERCNSSVLAMGLRLSCIDSSTYPIYIKPISESLGLVYTPHNFKSFFVHTHMSLPHFKTYTKPVSMLTADVTNLTNCFFSQSIPFSRKMFILSEHSVFTIRVHVQESLGPPNYPLSSGSFYVSGSSETFIALNPPVW